MHVVIPLFPKNQGHYSIIPLQKFPFFLFHYSSSAPDSKDNVTEKSLK